MQKTTCSIFTVLTIALCWHLPSRASFLPVSTDQHIGRSAAVFRGMVEDVRAFEEHGAIYTRALLKVRESFKGKLPGQLELVYRGGQLRGRGESYCGAPDLKAGEERIFFISKNSQGQLFLDRGELGAVKVGAGAAGHRLLSDLRGRAKTGLMSGADLTLQAAVTESWATAETPLPQPTAPVSTATNLMVGDDGLSARFLQMDSGRPIPYLVDADYLPAGITLSQALSAVRSALGAWTNVSSARFEFAGLQSFGQAAENVRAGDGVLRIQLHDHYEQINGSSELGVGGSTWVIQNTPSGWTTGGQVAGNSFHATTGGFIMLEHSQAALQNLATLTEVLTHEVGHALGLGHSSQNDPEPVSLLREAIMFWVAHADGRGAQLNTFDINVCRQVYPLDTPPVCFNRYLDVITGPTLPSLPGLNSAQVPLYDAQGSSLSFVTADATSGNGAFTVSGNTITYTPAGWYADSGRYDVDSGLAIDRIYVRCSDGLNASPWAVVAVLSFNEDTYNEGVPNWWRNTWFGSPNPSAGPNRHVNDDFDGDGFSNLAEWQLGSDPTQPASNLRITSISRTNLQFQARAADVYELQRSTNQLAWTPLPCPFVAQGSLASIPLSTNSAPWEFFRLRRIP